MPYNTIQYETIPYYTHRMVLEGSKVRMNEQSARTNTTSASDALLLNITAILLLLYVSVSRSE